MIRRATADAIAAAADLIRSGAVVAFPTETVYGLAADAGNATAVARIFAIKARPAFDPLIVHIDRIEMLAQVADAVPRAAAVLAERFWPGPLTIVLRKTARIPDIVTAGLPSVAVRLPDHAVARSLIAAAGAPLAAPSANPFGYVSPTTAAHVEAQLGAELPLILDGGSCRVGVESTIVSCAGADVTLLRAGGVGLEDLERVVGPLRIAADGALPLAPGQLPRHYAPRSAITIVASARDVPPAERADAALLLPYPAGAVTGFARVEVLSTDGALTTVAANLFAALRRLDDAGCARIYAVAVPETGLGRAIMDRLRRASAR
jgi:L-threonylcarbamoyladenylate synthase